MLYGKITLFGMRQITYTLWVDSGSFIIMELDSVICFCSSAIKGDNEPQQEIVLVQIWIRTEYMQLEK